MSAAMNFIGDMSTIEAPCGIVLQVSYTLNDVPMPLKGELLENFNVVWMKGSPLRR